MARQDERRRDIGAAMRSTMSSPVTRRGTPMVPAGSQQAGMLKAQFPGEQLSKAPGYAPASPRQMQQGIERAARGRPARGNGRMVPSNTSPRRPAAQDASLLVGGGGAAAVPQYLRGNAGGGIEAAPQGPVSAYGLGGQVRGNLAAAVEPAVGAGKAAVGAVAAGARGVADFGRGLLGLEQPPAATGKPDPRTASVDGGGPAVTPGEAGLAERGGLGGIDAFGSNPYVPMGGREAPAGGEGLPAGFSRVDGGGYQGPQGSLTVEGPQSGAAGLGGQVRRSSPTGLDAATMQRANENARAGGGGGFLGIVGDYSGPTSTTGMSDEQKAAFEQQRQADIASNVAGIEAQTAAVREQRNALRAARGEPLVGEQRYTGPAVNRDSGLDAYSAFRRSNAAREVPTGLSRGRKADMLIQAQELEEQRAQRLQQGQTDARAAGIDAFEAQSADAYRRGSLENDRVNAQQQAQGGIEQARINAVKEGFKQQLAADRDETAATREARESVIDRVTEYLATPPEGAMQGDQLGKLGDGMDFLASAVDAGVSDPARLFGATKVYLDGLLTPEQAREQAEASVGGMFAREETIEAATQALIKSSAEQAREQAQRLLFGE